MGKKSSPKAPDYEGAAEASAQGSKENTAYQTWANRPDQTNPWGSVSWDNQQVWDPASNQYVTKWQQTENIDPNAKAALDAQIDVERGRSELAGGMLGRVGNEIGQSMDWSQFGGMQRPADTPMYNPNQLQSGYEQGQFATGFDQGQLATGYDQGELATDYDQRDLQTGYGQEGLQRQIGMDPNAMFQSSADAAFQQAQSRLNPQFEAEENALEIKLRNQGLKRGDQAYESALGALNARKTDAFNQANMSAQQQGGADASRLFGMYQGQGEFANQATNQMNMNQANQAGFFNQATAGMNQQDAARANFAAQNQQTMNQNQAAQAGFYNQATQGMSDNAARAAEFYNQGTGAQNAANAGQADFYNQAQQQQNAMNMAGSQYNQDAQYRQSDYANQLRQQQIQEEMTKRGFSLNEMNALLSGQQVQNPNFENFGQATKADSPDYLGAAIGQGNFDQSGASGGDMMSGLGGLMQGGAAMYGSGMFSDRRLKRNIKRIGTLFGYPLYIFDYIWGKTSIGFMSDEVNQDAVSVHSSGYDWINLNLVREK